MPQRIISSKRMLITGASRGIGRALAVEVVKRGAKVLAVARDFEALRELEAECPGIVGYAGDVTSPADRSAMIQAVLDRFGGLDILVNNAGVGATGFFGDTGPDTLRRILEVNLFALAELTRLAIPHLQFGAQPMIVNVSSIFGRRGFPRYAEYCASKFAVQGFSDALRAELITMNIGVLVMNPGPTETGFQENMLERSADTPRAGRRMPAEAVASAMIRAIEQDKAEITLTGIGKALILATRLAPRLLDWYLCRGLRASNA